MTSNDSKKHRSTLVTEIAVIAVLSVCLTNHATAAGEKWKRSTKTDGIETFYRADKTGTDTFDVNIRFTTHGQNRLRLRCGSNTNPAKNQISKL